MRLFGRKKSKPEEDDDLDDEEEEDEEDEEESQSKKKTKRVLREKKAPTIKPWGKRERIFILFIFGFTAISSGALALYARSWKLPGLPKISAPRITLDQTVDIVSPVKTPAAVINKQNQLYASIRPHIDNLSGVYSLYVENLVGNFSAGINEKETMQAASLIKLPVLIALYQEAEKGNIRLEEVYTLKDSDKVGGSGSIYGQKEGTKYTLRKLAEAMGKQSDNTAFNVVTNRIGENKISEVIRQIGMSKTSIATNKTSAYDIGLLFKLLWAGKLVSDEHKDEILGYLTQTIYEDWIPASIKDKEVVVSHKFGREIHVINDAGIVFMKGNPFILVIMTDGIIEKEATIAIPEIVRKVYSFEEGNF